MGRQRLLVDHPADHPVLLLRRRLEQQRLRLQQQLRLRREPEQLRLRRLRLLLKAPYTSQTGGGAFPRLQHFEKADKPLFQKKNFSSSVMSRSTRLSWASVGTRS